MRRFMKGLPVSGRCSSRCEDHAAHPDYAKLSHGLGVLLLVLGDSSQARSYTRISMEGAQELGDAILLASNLRLLSQIAFHHGELSEAEGSCDNGRATGPWSKVIEWQLASALSALAKFTMRAGDFERAERVLSESAVLFEKAKDYWELSGPLRTLGYIALHKREVDSAVELFRRSIAACQRYQGGWFLTCGLEGLASSLCFKGEWIPRQPVPYWVPLTVCGKSSAAPFFPSIGTFTIERWNHSKRECKPELRLSAWNKGREMTREQIIVYALEG